MNILASLKKAAGRFVLGAKFALGIQNLYEGARWSWSRSNINSPLQIARLDITKCTREELQRKSVYFEQNDPIFNRLADLWELYIAGRGPQLSPASSSPEFNQALSASIRKWYELCDFSGRQSFGTLTSLWERARFVYGGVFIILTKGETGAPRLQTIEPHLCKTPDSRTQDEGKSIIDGVEVDGNGRVLGYWFEQGTQDGKKVFQFIAREMVIHHWEPSRAGQYREIPCCHPVINELQDLHELHLLEMQAAKENAKIARFVQTETGEISDEDILRSSTGTSTDDGKERFKFYESTFGGEVRALLQGDKITQFASERPSVVTREYWRYKTELVCTGIGIPYVLVFPDSMQGTVYRGALDMANAFFRARFNTLEETCKRIFIWYAAWAIQNDPAMRGIKPPSDWTRCTVVPPKAVNVDVGRNSSALLAEIAAGVKSHIATIGSDGGDWKDLLIEKATFKKFALDLVSRPEFAGVTVEDLIAKDLPASNAPPAPAPADPLTTEDQQNG